MANGRPSRQAKLKAYRVKAPMRSMPPACLLMQKRSTSTGFRTAPQGGERPMGIFNRDYWLEKLFPLLRNRYTFGAKVTFNCVERKILHPTLVNVVLHRDAEAFEGGMFVNVGLK